MNGLYTATEHLVILPGMLLALFGCAVLLLDAFSRGAAKSGGLVWITLLGLAFTGISLWKQQAWLAATGLPLIAFGGTLAIDGLAVFFNWVFLAGAMLVALTSYRYLEVEQTRQGEYYGLLLLAQCGMFFLVAGNELVTLFVALELMAVSFYVLVGYFRGSRRSSEAAMKYLLLGAFASGFLAYGFSVMYGIAGSTRLSDVANAVAARDPSDPMVFLAIATTAAGLFFKLAAAPFHAWAPDAYEGAPTTVTAYLAIGSKAASVALLLRLFPMTLGAAREMWSPLIVVVALVSLTIGSFAAMTQTNLKRLMAYSSIAHAGYLLLGVASGNAAGIQATSVYMAVYAFMTLGAFAVITALRRAGMRGEDFEDLSGLFDRSPGYAILLVVFLLSLAGIPLTAGFIGKYYIFMALIEGGRYVLAIVGALYIAVSIYYYFRVVRAMFIGESVVGAPPLATSAGLMVASAAALLVTLGIGIYPEPLLRAVFLLLS